MEFGVLEVYSLYHLLLPIVNFHFATFRWASTMTHPPTLLITETITTKMMTSFRISQHHLYHKSPRQIMYWCTERKVTEWFNKYALIFMCTGRKLHPLATIFVLLILYCVDSRYLKGDISTNGFIKNNMHSFGISLV